MSDEYDQNTDIAEVISVLMAAITDTVKEQLRELIPASNTRIEALTSELSKVEEGSLKQGKLAVIGASYDFDMKAVRVLQDIGQDLVLTLAKLESLRSNKFQAIQAMHGHLESIEAGNGGTLKRSAGSKLH